MDSMTATNVFSFRNTGKRSREEDEPASPTRSTLRPKKRPAVGLNFPLSSHTPTAQTNAMEEISEAPHIPSWRNSDDWVNRTGGLRLDSPLPWTIPN
ncbi:hypothetical protein FRB91_006596, partial [Serendipita sp. 411]